MRLNVDLGDEDEARLRALAKRKHTTQANVIRQALVLLETHADARDAGNHLAIANDRGIVYRVVLV